MTWGKIGCGDSLPLTGTRAGHAREVGHPIVRSAEPGEEWSWCFLDEVGFSARATLSATPSSWGSTPNASWTPSVSTQAPPESPTTSTAPT
jgi:hypothetical protein